MKNSTVREFIQYHHSPLLYVFNELKGVLFYFWVTAADITNVIVSIHRPVVSIYLFMSVWSMFLIYKSERDNIWRELNTNNYN